MAAPRRIPKWIQISTHCTQEGSQRVNDFSYKYLGSGASTPTLSDLNIMAQGWWAFCGVNYRALCSPTLNVDYVTARWLDPAGPPLVGQYLVPQPAPGTGGATALPSNAAAVISFRTGLAGRAYRGRAYIPGLTTASATGSTLSNTYLAALQSLANNVIFFTNASGSTPVQAVVASFVNQVLTPMITFVIDSAVDSMRRRLIGRGR